MLRLIKKDQTIKIKKILCILLLFLAVASIANGIQKGFEAGIDFQWDSIKVLSLRENPYLASDISNGSEYYDKYSDIYGVLEANQFPSLLWLLFPYTFLTPTAARIAWVFSNVFFLFGSVILCRKLIWKTEDQIDVLLLSLLFIASTPIRKQIFLGQHTLFSFFFFLLAWFLMEQKHDNLSGIALAISYFKYSLTAPLMLIFLIKRRYRPIVISGIIHIVLTLFSACWLQENPITLMIQPLRQASWLTGEGFADLNRLLGLLGAKGSVSNCLTILIFGILFIWAILKKCKFQLVDFVFLTYVSMIFMYHRRYDYFVMIIPLWYFVFSDDVKQLYQKNIGKNYILIGRIAIVFHVVALFLGDAVLDPMTGVGTGISQLIPSYANGYDIYCGIIVLAFYISFGCIIMIQRQARIENNNLRR